MSSFKIMSKKYGLSLTLENFSKNNFTYILSDFYGTEKAQISNFFIDFLEGLKNKDSEVICLLEVSEHSNKYISKLLAHLNIDLTTSICCNKLSGTKFVIGIIDDEYKLLEFFLYMWDLSYVESLYFILPSKSTSLHETKLKLNEAISNLSHAQDPLSIEDPLLDKLLKEYPLILSRGHDGNWLNIATNMHDFKSIVNILKDL